MKQSHNVKIASDLPLESTELKAQVIIIGGYGVKNMRLFYT